MKHFFIPLFFFLATFSIFSQKYSLSADLIDQYTDNDIVDIIVASSIDSDGFHNIELSCGCGNSQTFKMKPMLYPNFQIKMKEKIAKLITTVIDDKGNALTVKTSQEQNMKLINNRISRLFARIVTFFNSKEERPEVATIKLKNQEIPVFLNTKDEKPLSDKLTDISVEISFFGGFIEKMQVNGTFKNEDFSFNNTYSIGISSTKNIKQLSEYILFSNEKVNYKVPADNSGIKLFTKDEVQEVGSQKNSLYIKVDDVIRYIKKVDVNANDISPVPQAILIGKDQTTNTLYKEESSRLFEAVAYTDLIGLFDEENPNGLVQLEVKKRFNLNTRRSDVKWYHKVLFPLAMGFEGIGFFQNLDGFFQYSKIEENNKFLNPEIVNTVNDQGSVIGSEQIYSPLFLMQHRNYAIGGVLNMATLENQNTKINMYVNAGVLFGRTGIIDSSDEEFFVNNIEVPIEVTGHILPEKRVSFSFTDRLSWFDNLDGDLNIKSLDNGNATSYSRWLNSFNIDLNVNLASTGKLFIRYKLIHELDNINNNFSQLQFGYSFYILKNNGVKQAINN